MNKFTIRLLLEDLFTCTTIIITALFGSGAMGTMVVMGLIKLFQVLFDKRFKIVAEKLPNCDIKKLKAVWWIKGMIMVTMIVTAAHLIANNLHVVINDKSVDGMLAGVLIMIYVVYKTFLYLIKLDKKMFKNT